MGTGDAHCGWETATGESLPLGRVYPELNTVPRNRNNMAVVASAIIIIVIGNSTSKKAELPKYTNDT